MPSVSYTPLEPSPIPNLAVPTLDGTPSLLATSTFLYTLFFLLIVGGAFYRYGVAGVLRMQASENSIRQSNEIIKKVTLGLLGVFSLFLILFTVNKGLVTGDVGLEGLKGSPVVNQAVTQGPVAAPAPGPAAGAPSGNNDAQNAINEDPRIRRSLSLIGINVNKSVCSSPSATGCTTVGGITPSTLSMLQTLRSTCRGDMTITGGTEAGHKSHGAGKHPVDLRIGDQTFDSCIQGFRQGPSYTFCKRTYTNFGYIFCDEKNTEPHWHVFK